MNNNISRGLTRIGIFYDGNYFYHVSNYYAYQHESKSRISISGLHDFIRREVAREEGSDYRRSRIVDAHYFRGRLSAREANQNGNKLYYDRVFDDILMSEGVTTHYLPVRGHRNKSDKVDMSLALEAFELAFYKNFDVVVLIAGDSDYVPLVRKLNTLGTRVMLLSWDFEYYDDYGELRATRSSRDLGEAVTYLSEMHDSIDQGLAENNPEIANLFVSRDAFSKSGEEEESTFVAELSEEEIGEGFEFSEIVTLNQGYGFVKATPSNLFFHYSNLAETDFLDLDVGNPVKFKRGITEEGKEVAYEVTKL
ncbi:hypothetical protein FUAX_26870 [Fulvitalea axinellae]|uniref:NYN domain-containing protein n=1 Tax=Fulvitalea axinellae TaxID=1182444 RepID=A0AAU9DGT5_9BACT|nr:hypothetical protein FUAX_26870 [Fulvitalea axinellae]